MNSNKKIARFAGLVYLMVVLCGIFSLMYVPSKLIVWSDASATVNNIIASESLYRLGAVSGLLCYTFFLILPLVLYKLLSQVDKTMASLMVILAVVSVPISFISILYKFDILSLLSGAEYLKVLTAEQLQAQVMLSLESYNNGILIASIFWGLWLFPFGYLVFKSGFLPKTLGIFLMLGSLGYLINFFGYSLLPHYDEMGISSYIRLPASIGELGICVWFLIFSAKNKKEMVSTSPS
ncbi:DUF4386 domain-containing protein [Marivirga sp. S37H4]|uniref:DUF4386 domain-containing protein n=1 Tax=Marivirga aurantiaca TaxID=2802615 RepID=A0A934X0N1_9BACT|nr:DUF4386 domain-containing protein [Marivirga aurantiaca]MBK6266191.1 DUF4386 domain-containing protein [Marivirga aurantiaca]